MAVRNPDPEQVRVRVRSPTPKSDPDLEGAGQKTEQLFAILTRTQQSQQNPCAVRETSLAVQVRIPNNCSSCKAWNAVKGFSLATLVKN